MGHRRVELWQHASGKTGQFVWTTPAHHVLVVWKAATPSSTGGEGPEGRHALCRPKLCKFAWHAIVYAWCAWASANGVDAAISQCLQCTVLTCRL
eukprot:1160740-Pelagomonas_calceolata.AAC.7